MADSLRRLSRTFVSGWATIGIVAIALGACSDTARRQEPIDLTGGSGAGAPSATSGAGGDDTMSGSCEPGDVRG